MRMDPIGLLYNVDPIGLLYNVANDNANNKKRSLETGEVADDMTKNVQEFKDEMLAVQLSKLSDKKILPSDVADKLSAKDFFEFEAFESDDFESEGIL